MAYEIKPGTATVFANKQKTNERYPDFRGQMMTPQGELLEIALWWKEGKSGKFLSGKVQAPYGKTDSNYAPKKDYQRPIDDRSDGQYAADDLEDKIPW